MPARSSHYVIVICFDNFEDVQKFWNLPAKQNIRNIQKSLLRLSFNCTKNYNMRADTAAMKLSTDWLKALACHVVYFLHGQSKFIACRIGSWKVNFPTQLTLPAQYIDPCQYWLVGHSSIQQVSKDPYYSVNQVHCKSVDHCIQIRTMLVVIIIMKANKEK